MAEMLGVELARPGNWRLSSGKRLFDTQDLRDAADFFAASGQTRIPIGFGHTDSRFDGEPAFGWVANIRYTEDAKGPVLLGDLVDMADWVSEAAPKHWPNRSIEGFANLDHGGRTYRLALTRLALLGATPPAMPTLRSLADLRKAVTPVAAAFRAHLGRGGEFISASMADDVNSFDPPRAVSGKKGRQMDVARWGYETGRYREDRVPYWRGLIEQENNRIAASGTTTDGQNSVEATIRSLYPALAGQGQHLAASYDPGDDVYEALYGTGPVRATAAEDELDREIARLSPPRHAQRVAATATEPIDPEYAHLYPPRTREGAWARQDAATQAQSIAAGAYQGYDEDELERDIARLSPPSHKQAPVPVRAAAPTTVWRPNPYARNPAVDELRELHPGLHRAALADSPPPTLFESGDGDVPTMCATDLDPNDLLQLPWMARHPAAETRDKRAVMQIFEECAADPDWATWEYGQHPGNTSYIARVTNWAAGHQRYGSPRIDNP